ncbi:alpha/beta hydrolase [Roseiconus nitratireducens]|uniref:Alpha/beta hydrolase n=1 Tax=Roseiconus nitratireducens TaxID=2605748 RepID=A0A5M6DFW1_9BACT|nr:alpha/beta hydrolase [Roseiconus nitratireducens]KAA5545286.1 alpha/beta hydrolase [Roseiconus nitratireducens]
MRRLPAGVFVLAIAFSLTFTTSASAQRSRTKVEPPPKPRPVKLRTKDGVDLSAFYFGSNKGKEAIPVLLVHEWEGQMAPYGPLCMALRDAGCAVLALDYRGHGGSREYTDASGKTESFNLETMGRRDILGIVQYDLEEAKKFLERENNDGKLNLNALAIIGVREGCVLAAGWAQRDWQFPNVGSRKQGRDVKALVLVSPERLLKGVPIEGAISNRNVAALPTLIVVGEGSEEQDDADRIYRRLGVVKRRLSGGSEPDNLTLLSVKEPLGGSSLVTQSPTVVPKIVEFITSEIEIGDQDNPWIERE